MFSSNQLPKLLLSLVMSGREVDCYEEVIESLLVHMDKLDPNGTFLTIMALSKQIIELHSIPEDIFYLLYCNVVKHIDQFNVYDLSQIIGFFSNSVVVEKIPMSFWDKILVDAIYTGIENYVIYGKQKDMIDKAAYMTDLVGCFLSFSFGPFNSPQFWTKVENFLLENLADIPDEVIENVIFIYIRTGAGTDLFWKRIYDQVEI